MSPAVMHEFPEPAVAWEPAYWLEHCEDYRVDTPAGSLGYVEKVLHSASGEPEALAVRTSHAQSRLVIVPIGDVAEIRPEWEIVSLRSRQPAR